MNLITAEHLTHSFTERKLFDDVSFSLNEDEKVGIIGINGTGKSTLLKILAKEEIPDQGTITTGRNLRIAYLPQNPAFEAGETTLLASLPRQKDIATSPGNYEADAKSYLTKLGFTDFDQPVQELSGGQRKRVALVRTLLTPCDVFILDEPTNHLDSAMAEWLEEFLQKTKNALIMITHDRYFLDSVVNRIVEIDKGKLYSYPCSYLEYVERKAQREDIAQATERKRQSVLRKEIAWMQRGARARSTKQKAHIARYETLRDMDAPVIDQTIEISSASSRLGKTTIELEDLTKSYDGHKVLDHFSYIFLRNDRIGIIGPNGCGKSTLLKIIAGIIEPDSGEVEVGDTIKLGYFSQEIEDMNSSQRVIDYIKDVAEFIPTKDGLISASKLLEQFLFDPAMQYAPIEKLSGGEKKRLYLLKVLAAAPNVLLLDEITNDIDIPTLTILEDYLDSFAGIVIAVSHDRYFLDNIADRIFEFDREGNLTQYEGGYTDYLEAKKRREGSSDAGSAEPSKVAKTAEEAPKAEKDSVKTWKQNRPSKLKFSYKEQREFETIDDDIAALEARIEKLDAEIMANATNSGKLNELTQEKTEAEAQLEEKMDRWVYLNDLAEQIEAQNNN